MDFQRQTSPLSSFVSGTLPEHLQMDLEVLDPHIGASVAECSCSTTEGSMDIASRAHPRVDSCPDMDTRPPLTPEIIGIDLDATQGGAFHMHELLNELPNFAVQSRDLALCSPNSKRCEADPCLDESHHGGQNECQPCLLHIAMGKGLAQKLRLLAESGTVSSGSRGLFIIDGENEDMFNLLQYDECTLTAGGTSTSLARLETLPKNEQQSGAESLRWKEEQSPSSSKPSNQDFLSSLAESDTRQQQQPLQESDRETLELSQHNPAVAKVPGPCEPEDLLDGVVFGAKYLGSTQLQCERHQMPSTRMQQAQEAVDRVKAPAGESQPTTEVDVMVSTQCVKVLIADSQEAVMEHQLQTISYTADIDSIVVIMARRKSPRSLDQSSCHKRPHKMLCHVFQSVDVSPLLGVIKKKKWAC
ncbi:amyloid-beta A4 precursor protein-binding family A member 3 [Mixophyes fleayi]|uniref:amyloid-beta A4 precursor protein-binding family A member 3 n=1 Tax=Mixophyes fleayi TaxID=3061075 RepID=UPI003F4DF40F